ncbi:hemerythrin domain-containing protein [Pusillimonas sp. MFBS29]|uniref:hemerythrin domain-containing protein n=1 Tax=Pusillimonas sp. MFBS29 TaxID=2886690 RepID=UPI001D0F5C8F|nr:hemerythrin domain-containing protein [Pusillimonas sp. MFBS29]MCC2597671.1 hemerythrin domain-containing protein [Pusillimonas sp. MFBS29]
MNTLAPGSMEQADWQTASVEDLVAYIVKRFHERHREELPELIRLARKVEHVHASNQACPAGLADVLEGLQQALESHMLKEEQVLFPMLLKGMGALARGPVAVMRFEHDEQDQALAQIHQITNELTLPDGACGTWQLLYEGLKSFTEDLSEHIHLENDVLFLKGSNAAKGVENARV